MNKKEETKPTIGSQRVQANAYALMVQCVNDGIEIGWRRSRKYEDNPSEESTKEHVHREVMNSICEWFDFCELDLP